MRVVSALLAMWCLVGSVHGGRGGMAAVHVREQAVSRVQRTAGLSPERRRELLELLHRDDAGRVASTTVASAAPSPSASECLAYLVRWMPDEDLQSANVTQAFLRTTVDLALKARSAHPWATDVPAPLFLNEVLPYASLSEPRGEPPTAPSEWAWRSSFREQVAPLVASARNLSEAAMAVNTGAWCAVEGGAKPCVHFLASPACEINSYAPLQTVRRHNSSCTGLATLLVAAMRSVGVPARVVGTPHWNKGPKACPDGDADDACGNHDWIEVWVGGDAGGWAFVDPDGCKTLNCGWFASNTKLQVPHKGSFYNHSIVASSWASTASLEASDKAYYPLDLPITHFPMVWDWQTTWVPGWDVTERYLQRV
eukprot:m.482238 g.482238  ORF g.482238 m.482238 type:complete len:368 (-) comp22478_c0_seq1:19-1122(-)